MDWRDIARRSAKTFAQAAFGYVVINAAVLQEVTDFDTLQNALLTLAVGAVGAGACAVWNMIQQTVLKSGE